MQDNFRVLLGPPKSFPHPRWGPLHSIPLPSQPASAVSKFHYWRRPIRASRHFKKFGDLHLFRPGWRFLCSLRAAKNRYRYRNGGDHKNSPVIRALSGKRNARCDATNVRKCVIVRQFADSIIVASLARLNTRIGRPAENIINCLINYLIYYYLKILSDCNSFKKFTRFYRNSIDHVNPRR